MEKLFLIFSAQPIANYKTQFYVGDAFDFNGFAT